MTFRQYRCIVSSLNIRTQPQTADQYKTNQFLTRGDVIDVLPGRRVDLDGYTWLQHDRGWSAERSLDGRFVFLTDATRQRDRMVGLNIDPNNPKGNPLTDKLTGLGWVRFVLQVDSRRETLDQSFAFYDPIIKGYYQSGTRVILVVLQDTYGGNAPWLRGDWPRYHREFADRLGLIAKHYRGQVAAYEIWNEMDLSGQPTSIYIAPSDYAGLLSASALAVAQNDPAAKVITGGVASGVNTGIAYLRDVRSALGGYLPVDGVAVHPYTLTAPGDDTSPFAGWSNGNFADMMSLFAASFPNMPVWITEVGVPVPDFSNASYWPNIARYMDRSLNFLRSNYNYAIPAVVWYAWSDAMHGGAGITSADQLPKGAIFTTFFQQILADYPPVERPVVTPFDGRVTLAHVAGEAVPDASLSALALRVATSMPNVQSLMLKTSVGLNWLPGGGSRPGVASPTDLATWVNEFEKYRIQVHVWHEIAGLRPVDEMNMLLSLARTPGVASVVIDLKAGTLSLRTADQIRAFMVGLRKSLPAGYPLGLSFEGRSSAFAAVNLSEWYPFIDTWHPKIFYLDWGGALQGPKPFIDSLFSSMRQYVKPVVPMFQAGAADQVRQAGRVATEDYGTPGYSIWELSALSADQISTVHGLYVPWVAGYNPAPMLGTLIVKSQTAVHIRCVPNTNDSIGVVLGDLQPSERIDVLERRVIGNFEWVRHRRGWSASRNTSTGDVYLG